MPGSDEILRTAAELESSGVPFVLATVVRCESPTSAKPGAKAVVHADGRLVGWIGGGCAQPAVISVARKALADGQPRLIRISPTRGGEVEEGIVDFGMTCHSGGTLDIFLEPHGRRPSLLVVGTSPAAQALVPLATATGFDVFVAGPGADAAAFPTARQVLDGLGLADLACATPDYAVVATQGKRDEEGLEAVLGTGADQIAFIASRRKAAKLREYLKERGHDGSRVDAILSPAGVDIGAVTPEEIALSVLASVVKARRTGNGIRGEPAAPEAGQAAAEAIDPVCGMSVRVDGAEYSTEYRGKRYYFCCAGCQHQFQKEPDVILSQRGSEA